MCTLSLMVHASLSCLASANRAMQWELPWLCFPRHRQLRGCLLVGGGKGGGRGGRGVWAGRGDGRVPYSKVRRLTKGRRCRGCTVGV
jgi:hypothetical protein